MPTQVVFQRADRLKKLPPYLFAEIDRMKREAQARGAKIIDLGVGDPDRPTPTHIIDKLCEEAYRPANHQYASYRGLNVFREECARWFKERFGVSLDPEREILSLIGSKEGIAHLPLAFINPGDTVLVPDPGYPVYTAGTVFADGVVETFPLLRQNGFLPCLDEIPEDIAQRTKMIWVNYPNNPTAAVATRDFFADLVEFAHKHNIIVCHDMAYSEVAFDGYEPPSILEVYGAKDIAIEFHSLSKSYNMTGWRLGFAVGNEDLISGLGAVKTNIDSGVFQAIQYAGITALKSPKSHFESLRRVYQERRDVLVDGLNRLGWGVDKPKAAFYVWIPNQNGLSSTEFTALILQKASIVTTPGVGFGPHGEGYIRMTLTVEKEELAEAVARLEKIFA